MASSPDTRTSDAQHYVDFDEYIEYQLAKTRSHIKSTDVCTTLVWVCTLFLGYLLAFVVCDQWVIAGGFGEATRAVLLGIVFLALSTMLVRSVVLPMLKRVNALYAARVIESADPALHGSLLNFVDLRDAGKPTPKPVLRSIEKRAAMNLEHFDVEQAVDRRSLLRVCYLLLGMVIVAALYTVLSPKDVLTSLKRALLPTADAAVATQTTIADVTPGDDTLPARSLLTVEALIGGRLPDVVGLYYTTADHKYVDQLVEMRRQEETNRYRGVITGENGRGLLQDVKYYIAAGDAHTRDYAVTVVQPPSATVDEIHYTYPDYMKLSPRTQPDGHINAWVGTVVTFTATTNMPVKSARLVFSDLEGVRSNGEEQTLTVIDGTRLQAKRTLEIRKDGTFPRFYRIECTTEKGETDPDPTAYTLLIRPDQAPDVTLLAPKEDLKMPANGVVPLLIQASDPDFLLRSISLRVQKRGELLNGEWERIETDIGQPAYRGTHRFKLEPLGLQAGENIEFWIEAKDNRHPIANRTNTTRVKIEITSPASPQEVSDELDQEEQRQQDQLAQADTQLNPEGADLAPQPDREKQPDGDKKVDTPQEQPANVRKERKPEPKTNDEQTTPENEQIEPQGKSGDEGQKSGAGQKGAGGQKQKLGTGGEDDADVLKKLIDQNQEQKQDSGKQDQDNASSGGNEKPKGGSKPKDDAEGDPQSNPNNSESGGKKSAAGKKANPAGGGDKSDPKQEPKSGDKQQSDPGPKDSSTQDKQASQDKKGRASSKEMKAGEKGEKKEDEPESKSGPAKPDGKKSEKPNPRKDDPGKDDSGKDDSGKDDSGKPDASAESKPKPDPTGQPGKEDKSGKNDQTGKNEASKPGEKDPTDHPADSGEKKKPGDKAGEEKPTAEKSPKQGGDKPQGGSGDEEKPQQATPDNETPASKKEAGMKPDSDKESGDKQSGDKSQSGQGDEGKPDKSNTIPKAEQSGESGGEKTAPRESKNKPQPRKNENLEGEEKPADPTSDATKKKATGDETGKGVPDEQPDGQATKAKNKLDKEPGTKGARRDKPRSADPQPNAKKSDAKEPDDAEGNPENASPNPGEAKPAPKRKTDNPDSVKSDKERDSATPKDVKNPPEKQSGQPESGEDELKGKGRPQGQKSDQPQGAEAGGSKQNEQGNEGGNESGAGDRSQKPGSSEKAGKPTGKPGQEKGTGSTTKGAEQGDKSGESGDGKPTEKPDGKQGAGKSGNSSKSDSNSDSKPDDKANSPKGNVQSNGAGKPSGGSDSSSGGGAESDQPGDNGEQKSDQGGRGGRQEGNGTGDDEGNQDEAQADKANLEYARKQSNLVLQRLKKQLDRGEVDQKLLDELGWTKDDMKRFVDRLEKQVSDSDNDTSPDATARRLQFEETLKGLKVRRGAASQTGDDSRQRRTQQIKQARQLPVPSEYREQYEAYTKSLSKSPAPKESAKPAPAKSK